MKKITLLEDYSDDDGNVIEYSGPPVSCSVTFSGKGNILRISSDAHIGILELHFDCDGGRCIIGAHRGEIGALRANIRIGLGSAVNIGNDVTSTSKIYICAVEQASVTIGDDCMFASSNAVRSDDSHPIFDVNTGVRLNPARNVEIGNHVWLGEHAVVMGGAKIGEGSVIGMSSIVKGNIPNNCIAAGIPAKVKKVDIAWERPHLSLDAPYLKADSSSVVKSAYWKRTVMDSGDML